MRLKRRPGRFRRWLLRPVIWIAVAVLVMVLVAHLLLQSDYARWYLRATLEQTLEAYLGQSVEIEEVDFDLLPMALEVGGLVIGDPTPGGTPFARVRRIVLDADLGDLHKQVLTLREVRLEEPRIWLDDRGPGDSNLPHPRLRGAGPTRFQVILEHLTVVDGSLEIDQRRLPLELQATAVTASFAGGDAAEGIQGSLTAESVEILLPKARQPASVALAMRLAIQAGTARILSARINAPDLAAQVRGTFTWRDTKELVLEVEASGDLVTLDRLGYLRGQVEGPFSFDGGVAWRPEAWGARGRLSSDRLHVLDRHLEAVSGILSADRNGLRIDLERAGYGGGNVKGVIAWNRDEISRFEVDLLADRVSLDRVLADQGIPVQGLSGTISGVVDYGFVLGQNARKGDGWADLRVDAVPSGLPGVLAVQGTIPLLIEKGMVRTEAAQLSSDAQMMAAQGAYDLEARRGRFEYQIRSDRIRELADLLPFDRSVEPAPAWLPMAGSGEIEGVLDIAPEGTSTRLRMDLVAVEAPGAVADRVQGGMRVHGLGMEDIRLELLRPGGGLIVTGSVPFASEGRDDPHQVPFALGVDAAGWPVAQAAGWLPFTLPFEGLLHGSLTLAGDPETPVGELKARVEPVTLHGLAAESLELKITFDEEVVDFHRSTLECEAGDIVLEGRMSRLGEWLDFEWSSEPMDLHLEPLANLVPGALGGAVKVAGTLEGSLEQPRLEFDLVGVGLKIADQPAGGEGDRLASLRWSDGRVRAQAAIPGIGQLEGGGRADSERIDLSFAVSSPDLGRLAALAGSSAAAPSAAEGTSPESVGDANDIPLQVGGSAEGVLEIEGDLAEGGALTNRLRLDRLDLQWGGESFHNLEPVELHLEQGAVELDTFFMGSSEGQGEIILAGRITLGDSPELDLMLESTLLSEWFAPYWPELGIREGTFEILASLSGPWGSPEVNGQGVVSNVRLVPPNLPHAIEQGRGLVLFYPGRVVLDRLEARMAGGSLKASGEISSPGEGGPWSYRVQATGERLAINYPEGWLLRGNVEMVLASTEQGRDLIGTIHLDRAFYLEDVKLGLTQLAQGMFGRHRQEVGETDELLSTTQVSLVVDGPQAFRIRNNLADVAGGLDLLVRGTLARPVVFGTIELDEGGELVYGGNEYRVERGQLSFTSPFRIEPIIDLVAATRVREYEVRLTLSGPPDRLNATFSSNPPLANLEVLSLLTTGEDIGTPGERPREDTPAEGLLYGQAISAISSRVDGLFGLDRFRIDPLTGPAGNLSSARVTVGKRLSRDVFATYSYDPSTTAQQILQLEWQATRGMTVVLTQNGDDTFAVDLRWEKSF